jgi:hypothetical protein
MARLRVGYWPIAEMYTPHTLPSIVLFARADTTIFAVAIICSHSGLSSRLGLDGVFADRGGLGHHLGPVAGRQRDHFAALVGSGLALLNQEVERPPDRPGLPAAGQRPISMI